MLKRGATLWGHFLKFFKPINYDQTAIESTNLRTMYIFWGGKFDLLSVSKLWKVKLGLKVAKFAYYIPTVIERWNSVAMVFSRLVIQFFKILIWPIPNPSFWHYSKIGSKEAQICKNYWWNKVKSHR